MFTTMNNTMTNIDSTLVESKNPFESIEDYNQWLVESQTLLAIKEYIMNVRNMFYKNVDISFMDEFMDLCTRTDFCINANEMFPKYGVVSRGKTDDIKKCIERNDLIVGTDYNLRQVAQVRLNRGNVMTNIYILTPLAFKMCLIRSRNTRTYARYYLLLEQCVHYHNMYQLQLSKENNIILEKKCEEYEDVIADNKRLMNSLEKSSAEQSAQISMILNHLRISEDEKKEADAHIQEIAPDRVIRPEEQEKCGSFVLMKLQQNKFRAIRCQKRAVKTCIKRVEKKFPGATVWMRIDYHPNPVKFWNVIKNRVDFVSVHRNNLVLMNATEDDLREAIQELEHERLA